MTGRRMSNMLFVGKQERGYFIEEYAKEKNYCFKTISAKSSIEKQINEILEMKSTKYIIYDIDQYIDDADDLAKTILQIYKVNNAKVIILAPGYLPDSRVIQSIHNLGFNNFITSPLLSEMKDQFAKCMNGFYDQNPSEEISVMADQQKEVDQQHIYKTIAVVGAMRRIGTTTQAIQLCKYLLYNGYRVCYIEANTSDFINCVKDYDTDVKCDDITERVTYKSIDMYNNMQRIHEYLKMDYDFYIYDFGAWTDKGFFSASFLEKDIKIVVGGFKPNEIFQMTNLLRNSSGWDASYIFTSVADDSKKDILNLMEDEADHTYFSKYVPDMWHWVPCDYFHKICPCDNLVESHQKGLSKMAFWRRKRGGKGKTYA